MECRDVTTWLDAYIDLELEPEQAAGLVAHIRQCPRCAASVQERQRLRSMLAVGMQRHAAPASTTDAVRNEVGIDNARPSENTLRVPRWSWASLAATLLLAGVLIGTLAPQVRRSASPSGIVQEAISSHIRSLMADHLADVASTDQHTVKPWFTGRLDFSPRVVDFAAEGFPLVGGRLDYVYDRPAAALVYKRRAHTINLFTCLDPAAAESPPKSFGDRGFHALAWTEPGLRFCLVSDVNADDLAQLADLVRAARTGGTPSPGVSPP